MKRILPVIVAVAAGFATSSAMAGVVRGILTVPTTVAVTSTANPYPGRASSLPGGHGPVRGLVTDAVVYVDRVPAAAESLLARAKGETPKLSQKDQSFVPRVLAIPVGTAVDFPNLDPIYHNVFSLSPTRRFDLGKYPRGSSKRVSFPKAGLVNVFCDIHSDMAAWVLVLPHHAFTRPRANGAYSLPALPAGRYELKVWHPDFGEIQRTITVPSSADLTADLSF